MSVAVVVLAAGRSSRMAGAGHKLLARFGGTSLVRRAALAAVGAGSRSVVVVTGYRSSDVEAEIAGLDLNIARNSNFDDGMASSIVLGVQHAALQDPDGIMIMLADMPLLEPADIDDSSGGILTLIGAFAERNGKAIIRAVCGGDPGNPVVFPRAAFPQLMELIGDSGARKIITQCGLDVIDIEIGESAKVDIDNTEQLVALGGHPEIG
ncbi:nucleotidyltransferase family protein [Rhizobium sp. AN95]|uniref:nucleotidyltransferase family protein n=1 Tax=Rhizobium sp. AN95 TaxID=3035216 RepID=UPI002B260FCB|nr:nucleotidyltransferase family protein [Rhizobium sp. AN95]